jgi:FkbM family methyltransferase
MTNVLTYYTSSIATLFTGVKNPLALIRLATRNPSDQPLVLKLKEGTSFFVVTLMDAWILKETVLDRQYEQASVPLQPDWVVVDIGAALGDYSVWAARQLKQGRVIAIEPFPQSIQLIRANLAANQIKNVTVLEAAVDSRAGQTVLQLVTGQAVQHSTAAGNGSGSVTVSTVTLASILQQVPEGRIDYLKIDCEGAEYDILFDTPNDALQKVERICMEVHDGMTLHDHHEMIRFLQSQGYSTRLTPNPVHAELAYLYAERNRTS